MSNQETTTKRKITLNPLTPTNDAEKGTLYSDVLNDVIKTDGVYNIALTGGYGSGKSSIIETFIEKNKSKYRFLRVSLASFNFEKTQEEEKTSKASRVFGKSNSESDEKIALEISILQQLLYQLDSKKDGYSFRGRVDISWKQILPTIGIIIVGFISGQVLWNPYLLIKWFSLNFVEAISSNFWQSTFFLLLLMSVIFILYKIIYALKRLKISKVDVKPLSVEIEKRPEISTFNAFLDELIYAFKKIDLGRRRLEKEGVIVIFEDIDRVKGHQIFQKIRELNNILRYNPDTNVKNVKFIYAVKESIFAEEKDKNKFFDVIIPVLRYVNNLNSKEKLTIKFNEISQDRSAEFDEVIQIASYCIDEMRTINNIFNEFQIYQSTLVDTGKLPYKVLALVIYKNLFPKDFELIHSGESALQKLFEMREEFIKENQREIETELAELKEELSELDSDKVRSKDELKNEYILAACFFLKSGESFIFSGGDATIEDLHLDENFDKLLNGDLNIRSQYGGSRELSISQIEKKTRHQNNYKRRLRVLEEKNGGALESLRFSIQQKEKQFNAIKRLSFGALSPKITAENFGLNLEHSNYDKFKLEFIQVCINKGYIGADYKHYISVFHSNKNFSVEDRLFLMSVKANSEDQWRKVVEEPANVLNELSMSDWNSEALVNRSILEYLYNNVNENREGRKQLIKHVVAREDNLDIINELYNEVSGKTNLLSELMSEWQYFLSLARSSANGVLHFIDEVLVNVNPEIVKNQNTDELFAEYLSNQAALLDRFPAKLSKQQVNNFKYNMSYLWVKLDRLEISERTNLQLLDAVFEIEVFQLNLHMINLHMKRQGVDDYQFSYAGLKVAVPNSPILERIEYGKNDFILIAMKEALDFGKEWFEDQKTFLEIINDEMLTEDALEFLLINVQTDPVDIDQIDRKNILGELIHAKLIAPSWKNILAIHNPLGEENEELEFLLNDSDWVSKVNEPSEWSDVHEAAIYDLLGKNIDKNNIGTLLKNYPDYISLDKLFETTSISVVHMLVIDGHISFDRDNFDELQESYSDELALDLIIKNHESFLENPSEYSDFDVSDVLYITDISENDQLNTRVLGLITKDEIGKSSSDEIKSLSEVFNKYRVFDNLDVIEATMSKLVWRHQINWFKSIVDNDIYKLESLIELIRTFEAPYNAFADQSIGKWIPYTPETKLLNRLLKNLGLVNSMSKEKSKKILLRRNSNH